MQDWRLGGLGQEPFAGCLVQNCLVTDNRTYFGVGPETVANFDAVAFHVRDLAENLADFPAAAARLPSQVYVMFLMESPKNSPNFPYGKFGSVFNWTMTYR